MATPAWAAEDLSAEKLVVQARIHRLVHAMEFGFGKLWMVSVCGGGATLVRIESTNNEITDIRIHQINTPQTMAIGEAAVWIADAKQKAIFRIDPNDYSVKLEIREPMLSTGGSISVGEGAVWVITAEKSDKTLTRFNAQSGNAEAKISLPSGGFSLVVDYGSVWVTGYASNELYRIDPKTNTITSITRLRATPRFLAAGEGSIWVFNQGDSTVQRVDANTGELVATIETGLPHGSGNITTGGGYVWVSMQGVPVTQIDPKTNMLIRRFGGGHGIGGAIRYCAGSLLIAGGRVSRLRPPN
jgi:streptogramin lyase